MDRHTVAKYWREGESAADGGPRGAAPSTRSEEAIRAKAQLPGMTKMAVYAFLREGREGAARVRRIHRVVPGRDVLFGGAGGREPPAVRDAPGQAAAVRLEGLRPRRLGGRGLRSSAFTATLGYPGSTRSYRSGAARSTTCCPACSPPSPASAASRRSASRTTCRAW